MADFPLPGYREVPAEAKVNLLLGNGFSRSLHAGFQYGSLKLEAEKARLVGEKAQRLFEDLGTDDFERVLARLVEAKVVNKVHRLDNAELDRSYGIIREALIGAVKQIHPRRGALDRAALERCRPELRRFRRIFTTNYDLLVYWIAALEAGGEKSFKGFCDFFWGENGGFDPGDTREPAGWTRLYYLHGALFLSFKDDRTRKVRRQGSADLLAILRGSLVDAAPVFVSEGDAASKRRAIAQNAYLEWAYSELEGLDEGITVFGHQLAAQDSHILTALCRHPRQELAISVYENDPEKALAEVARLRGCFEKEGRTDQLTFFDARTFPLAGSAA